MAARAGVAVRNDRECSPGYEEPERGRAAMPADPRIAMISDDEMFGCGRHNSPKLWNHFAQWTSTRSSSPSMAPRRRRQRLARFTNMRLSYSASLRCVARAAASRAEGRRRWPLRRSEFTIQRARHHRSGFLAFAHAHRRRRSAGRVRPTATTRRTALPRARRPASPRLSATASWPCWTPSPRCSSDCAIGCAELGSLSRSRWRTCGGWR